MTALVIPLQTDAAKRCSRCHAEKPLSAFSRRGAVWQSACKACAAAYARQKRADPKWQAEKGRRQALLKREWKTLKRYGKTLTQLREILDSQHGRCANRGCGKPIGFISERLVDQSVADADHDHKTGKFRAILCRSCNASLGFAGDNVNVFLGLIEYLEKHAK